jgi:hypothetical protein
MPFDDFAKVLRVDETYLGWQRDATSMPSQFKSVSTSSRKFSSLQ